MILREYWTDGTIREKMADETVFAASYDVIVCGLGVAGSSALVTAAKTGLSVLGIEQFGTMGGQGTVGGIYGYYCGTKGGFYREIDRRAEEIHGEGETVETWGHGDIEKTEALAEYAERYGAETIYDTVVTGVYAADGKHVCGVRCLDARGTCRSYGAKMVIDCTAEGLVCMTAGCAMTSGRDTVNAYQPYTNVLLSYRGGRIQTANTDGGFVNQYDPFAFSLAVRESAGMPVMMWPKFAGSHRYLGRAPFLGAREGRCIVGEKRMEFRDILAGKQPEHPVFWCYANIDDHAKDSAFGSELYTIWMALLSQWRTNLSFPVPMEALIPLGFDGILAAGRCISMDHDVACALRMKDEMAKSGETAAYMAYLTITGDGNVRTIPYEKLSSMLRETGVIKEGDRDGYFLDLGDGMKKRELMTDLSEIRSALAADESGECPHPALALLSAYCGKFDLRSLLENPDRFTRWHAALVCAAHGQKECEPVLREMMENRDGFTPHTPAIFNVPYAIGAIAASGICGLASMTEALFDLLEKRMWKGIVFPGGNALFDNTEDVDFQYVSQTVMALCRIARKHPSMAAEIRERLKKTVYAEGFSLRVTLWLSGGIPYDMTDMVQKIVDKIH